MRGLVLAGGRSRRFGRDKALAPWRQGTTETFAERAFGALTATVGETWVSCRASQELAFTERLLHDPCSVSEGPGAGLREAHRLCPAEDWFVLACDYPGAGRECIEHLLARWDQGMTALVFAGERPTEASTACFEPLLGIWSARALSRFLETPLPSPQAVLKAVGASAVPCPDPKWLLNVNTPQVRAPGTTAPARRSPH